MNYSAYLSLVLLCAGSAYLNAFNKEDLAKFAATGDGRGADLRGTNLTPIIEQLNKRPSVVKHPGFRYDFIHLEKALLQGASLKGACLVGARMDGAHCDATTDFREATFCEEGLLQTASLKNTPTFLRAQLQDATLHIHHLKHDLCIFPNNASYINLYNDEQSRIFQRFIKETGAQVIGLEEYLHSNQLNIITELINDNQD